MNITKCVSPCQAFRSTTFSCCLFLHVPGFSLSSVMENYALLVWHERNYLPMMILLLFFLPWETLGLVLQYALGNNVFELWWWWLPSLAQTSISKFKPWNQFDIYYRFSVSEIKVTGSLSNSFYFGPFKMYKNARQSSTCNALLNPLK